MAAEPSVGEPKVHDENPDVIQDDEEYESDEYELEGEDDPANYHPEEEEEDDDDDEAYQDDPNLTAELLGGKTNGAHAEEDDEDEEDDEEYQENGEDAEGTAGIPKDLPSGVVGSKRGVEELDEDDAEGDQDDEGETVAKKARV